MKNIFLREESFYKRDIAPLASYIDQSSFYLSRIKNIPFEEAKEKIRVKVRAKDFPNVKDPNVVFYERPNFEDKEIVNYPLSQFLRTITTENLTMAPTLTCYVHASVRESLNSGFTDENVTIRNTAKKLAAKFKAENEMDKFKHYQGEQDNKKLYNNAMSGAYNSHGSVVNNPSAHSSLTSTTRTMTSIGNASNERLISGNRHYRSAEIALNNIIVLAKNANEQEIMEAVTLFGIKVPTVEETMSCVTFSTGLYWVDRRKEAEIKEFVSTLKPHELCSVVYTGDLYHLRVLNNEFILNFINELSRKVTDQTFDNPVSVIHSTDEMYVNYAHQICLSEVRGIGKDYSKLTTVQVNTVAATCNSIGVVLEKYYPLIRAFFLTANLPPSVAYIRDGIRRSVVLSDTDSTMFSCDEWVQWYFNKITFTDHAYAVSGAVMFMATQCIAHNLAVYSANLNVETKKLHMAAMKPEFVFPVFSLTSAGKHYYAYTFIKEGSVYKDMELEIKGVHLKSSAAPGILVKDAHEMMAEILETVMSEKKIDLNGYISRVANLEREIRRSVTNNETVFLGRLSIKEPGAYKEGPELSNYRHHLFWNETFGTKYGQAPEPVYQCIKLPTILGSKKAIANWLNSMEDKKLANLINNYVVRTGRKDINTLYVFNDLIENRGIPEEIKSIVDIDSLILGHMGAHRLILESLGFFSKHKMNLTGLGY